MTHRKLNRLSLELLEDRCTPANMVTGSFANGTWTLIGDAEANDIRINPTAILNQFEVAGLNGTAVVGVTNPSNVKNIVVKLKAGDDRVEVNNTGEFARLLGNLTMFGGGGANYVDIRDLKMKNLTVANGVNLNGADALSLVDSVVQRNVTVNNGDGSSEIGIYHFSSNVSSIGGNLTIINGVGEDRTQISHTQIGGSVTVKNGLPAASNEAGYLTIFNALDESSRSIIGGNVFVSYQGGSADGDKIHDIEVLGNVKFNYADGDGRVSFDGYSVVQPVHIHGNLTVVGQGKTVVDIGLADEKTGLIVGKNLTVLTGGAADNIYISHLNVGGATKFATGGGNDKIFMDDASFAGATTILTGADADGVYIERTPSTGVDTQFAKALKVLLGAGDDTLDIGFGGDDTRLVELLASARLNGGDGADTLNRLNLLQVFGKPIDTLFETINL